MKILVCNFGSSSLKFGLLDSEDELNPTGVPANTCPLVIARGRAIPINNAGEHQ